MQEELDVGAVGEPDEAVPGVLGRDGEGVGDVHDEAFHYIPVCRVTKGDGSRRI